MPRLASHQVPKLRDHRPSGRSVVTLDGRDYYCGPIGSEQAAAEYTRLVQAWWANGRAMPRAAAAITVGGLADSFASEYATTHRKRGEPSEGARRLTRVLAELKALYGSMLSSEFGAGELRTLRSCWTHPAPSGASRGAGVTRATSNQYQNLVLRAFRWGLARGLVRPETVVTLQSVGYLQAGEAPEGEGVAPVPDAVVEALLPRLRPFLATLVRLQRITGMRPGEVLGIRPRDLDRGGSVWIYTVAPEWNKSEHRRKKRVIALGPRAQELLRPWIEATPDEGWYVFRGRNPLKPYIRANYSNKIRMACDRAGLPRFTPNMLRHAGLTEARAKAGLDTAQSLGGHSSATMTERYAKVLPEKAIAWARNNG